VNKIKEDGSGGVDKGDVAADDGCRSIDTSHPVDAGWPDLKHPVTK